jgi:ornithine cyclodeaminase
MTQTFDLEQIRSVLADIDLTALIEEGFVAYSQGRVVVPPIGELIMTDPPGETHIKYGYITGDDYFVIKVASGFYGNVELGIPTGSGLMLVFSQKTGEPLAVLLDEAHLTDIRTAAAGAVAARYLAPEKVERIGIYGAGVQGRLQLEFLRPVVDCMKVQVWGINQEELDRYRADVEPLGYDVWTTLDTRDIPESCNLIVCVTPSKTPLVQLEDVHPGTHITAIGSDTPEKQEVDSRILSQADIVVVDSIPQSELRGEVYKAVTAGVLQAESVLELGNVIVNEDLQRQNDDQLTVFDSTGVAVQDIQVAKAVYNALRDGGES